MNDDVRFNNDSKFDIQLRQSHPRVKELARILMTSKFEKIEAKDETHQWRETGNICIEFEHDGKLSGILATEADHWVHTLRDDDGRVLVRLLFSTDELWELAQRYAAMPGRWKRNCGDGGRTSVVLIPIKDILK